MCEYERVRVCGCVMWVSGSVCDYNVRGCECGCVGEWVGEGVSVGEGV